MVEFLNLKVNISESSDHALLVFDGDIDEHFICKKIPNVQKSVVIIDLGAVRSINSVGLRQWVGLLEQLGGGVNSKVQGLDLRFVNCSIAMVDQFNQLPISVGRGIVESIYCPYYCPKCDVESTQLIDVSDGRELKSAPRLNCGECQSMLEFDALEESYFLFLSHGLERVG